MFHHALVLVLGIGIGIGQYYWVLGIGCLAWYHSNPSINSHQRPMNCLYLFVNKLQ